jgi:hypothetical protein
VTKLGKLLYSFSKSSQKQIKPSIETIHQQPPFKDSRKTPYSCLQNAYFIDFTKEKHQQIFTSSLLETSTPIQKKHAKNLREGPQRKSNHPAKKKINLHSSILMKKSTIPQTKFIHENGFIET